MLVTLLEYCGAGEPLDSIWSYWGSYVDVDIGPLDVSLTLICLPSRDFVHASCELS